MEIKYTEDKNFTMEQTENLFLSVGWVSGQYSERLYKALMNSSTVITAWDGDRLVGVSLRSYKSYAKGRVKQTSDVDESELNKNEILLDNMLFRMIQISENAKRLSGGL